MHGLILALLISVTPPQVSTGCSGPNPPQTPGADPNVMCTSSYDCTYDAGLNSWDCANVYSTCEVNNWVASSWGGDCVCEGCDSSGNFKSWYCFDCQTSYNKHHNQLVKPKEDNTWTTVKKLYKD